MPPKLSWEEIVTLKILKGKGENNCRIAQTLGLTEGAVRYHLRREGQADGRQAKPRKADEVAAAIQHFVADHLARDATRPVNVQLLFEWLVSEHAYAGSYKSVLRYVRDQYPPPRLRPYRRIETPPGAQAQVDWGEELVDLGGSPERLYGFVLVLSHSRKEAVIWSRRMDQLAWHWRTCCTRCARTRRWRRSDCGARSISTSRTWWSTKWASSR